MPVNISCSQDASGVRFHVTAYNSQVEKILDVVLSHPGTRIGQASECFVYWKDDRRNGNTLWPLFLNRTLAFFEHFWRFLLKWNDLATLFDPNQIILFKAILAFLNNFGDFHIITIYYLATLFDPNSFWLLWTILRFSQPKVIWQDPNIAILFWLFLAIFTEYQ